MTDEENKSPSTPDGAPSTPDGTKTRPKDTQATPPRGNPERDHESVDKGEEQLGRISGN